MENIKIWHTPHEQPKENYYIVFYVPEFVVGTYEEDGFTGGDGCGYATDLVQKWAYVKDLVATSKALDVAIENLVDIQFKGDENGEIAQKTLNEITAITKQGDGE